MSTLAGTPTLARLALRRDRVRLPVWVLAMTLLTYSSGSAMATTFPTQASIDSYASSMATSPSVVFLAGPPVALDTLAGIVLNKVSFLGLVGVCLMTVLQVVRHTRAEEEEGRAELVRAGVVGRDAAPVATMLVTGAAALLVGARQAVATTAAQVPVADALLYGASVAALGLVFAAIALCTAQVFTHARAASGSAMAKHYAIRREGRPHRQRARVCAAHLRRAAAAPVAQRARPGQRAAPGGAAVGPRSAEPLRRQHRRRARRPRAGAAPVDDPHRRRASPSSRLRRSAHTHATDGRQVLVAADRTLGSATAPGERPAPPRDAWLAQRLRDLTADEIAPPCVGRGADHPTPRSRS